MALQTSPAILSYTDSGTAAVDKINAGIEYLAFVKAEMDAVEATLAKVTSDGGLGAIEGLEQSAAAAETDIAELQRQENASATAVAKLAATLSGVQINLPLIGRPGDAPSWFTTDLASGISGLPPGAQPFVGPLGTVLRMPGAGTLATAALTSIEPNRTYKVRTALSRVVDTIDPSGDAVRFAVAWYGPDRNQLLGITFTLLADIPLAVAAGRVQYEALFSQNPPDQTNLQNPRVSQPPAGAAYFRPFIVTFGPYATNDIEVLAAADVTDAALVTLDLGAVLARLSRVEAALNLPAM